MTTDTGWFEGVDPDDLDARGAIENGTAESPADWPARAVESGFAADEDDYYDKLREATIETAREAVAERERADDQQLVHAVRAMDDCERTANELAERVAEWGGSRIGESGGGVSFAREIAEREPGGDLDEQLRALAEQVVDLDERAAELRASIERLAPEVAPNLAAMAGPVLAARLIALSGGLKQLARSASGTVQVLGAEDALFAHLRGNAPSPKHGVIYTHEYVRGTDPEHRGSAARALAGKLTLAARVDHYSGERRPELQAELDDRIETIRARGDGE
ncbi:RNA processing factor Prp31, contains Nop domain [Halapricum desulfuricans]|uniref:RNA processing factor Prp31, contains Nop domain n=1 Tax=Halapricum desulfuricans TaxID=2841257 RepID=A0A897NDW1_9EURY|nr:NOP5/NOP56 family protein [Halapricum desulfuricans]QSG12600.1 RNA processing factor Prp31, contains Nop domain [Halapricum desulfuricans]